MLRALTRNSAQRGAVFVCAIVVLGGAFASEADARTRQKRGAFNVALQPFLLARSVVHTVAEPIIEHAPRALAAVAAAPIRLAHRAENEIVRGEEVAEEQPNVTAEDEAVRVAYVVPRVPFAPRAEPVAENDSAPDEPPRMESSSARPMVAGDRAVLRDGIAYAPSNAPDSVKNAIWAANELRHKPYIYGGGHGSFFDRGYDCSGTVSFALHGAGVLATPMPSGEFTRFGERGRGRWITIYARRGHTFAVIAGLRLDTTDFRYGGNEGPRWHEDGRDPSGFDARHPSKM